MIIICTIWRMRATISERNRDWSTLTSISESHVKCESNRCVTTDNEALTRFNKCLRRARKILISTLASFSKSHLHRMTKRSENTRRSGCMPVTIARGSTGATQSAWWTEEVAMQSTSSQTERSADTERRDRTTRRWLSWWPHHRVGFRSCFWYSAEAEMRRNSVPVMNKARCDRILLALHHWQLRTKSELQN